MADTDIKGDRKSAPLLVFSKAFYTCWQAANQIKEMPQDWKGCTRALSHNMLSGHKTIDLNLEERQIFKQIQSFIDIV